MASKMTWTPQVIFYLKKEEEMLRELKEQKGVSSWKKIANILNKSEKDFSKTAKQYRDRYVNYIRFNESCPKIMQWTQAQQVYFLQKYFLYGAKWVQISLEMNGRSENNLKNKFYGLIRKVTRRIQNYERKLKPKPKKFTNQKYIIRALDECRRINQGIQTKQRNSTQLSILPAQINIKLIKLLAQMNEETSDFSIQELIAILKKVNCSSQKTFVEQRYNSTIQQSNSPSVNFVLVNKMFDETQGPNSQAESCLHEEQSLPEKNESVQVFTDFESMENLMELPIKIEQPFNLLDELCLDLNHSHLDEVVSLLG